MTSSIQHYAFKSGLAQEFEIVDIGSLYKEHQAILIRPHRAAFYHIIWYQEARAVHWVNFEPLHIKPNSLLFLKPNVLHGFDEKISAKGKAILFSDTFFTRNEGDTRFLSQSIFFNNLFAIAQIQVSKHADLLKGLLSLMQDELLYAKDSKQVKIIQNLLHSFILCALREHTDDAPTAIPTDADTYEAQLFKELLDNQYKTNKKVAMYAREMGIAPKRLNQATQKVLKKTPKQIIDEKIILEAKYLLIHSSDSIKEISYRLGFDEPTNFVKYFRQHVTLTPLEFRKHISKA